MYRIGDPILSNERYDTLHHVISKNSSMDCYTKRLYDDDPIPTELLKKYGLDVRAGLCKNDDKFDKYKNVLLDNKSFSIRPVENIAMAKVWFSKLVGEEVTFSLKVDGINTRNLFKRESGVYSHLVSSSRGRESDALIDYTESLANVMPRFNLNIESDMLPVFGEFYAKPQAIEYLSDKYRDYASPRSAGLSIARVPIDKCDYCHTNLMVFRIPGISNSSKESLNVIKELGFNVPPHETVLIDADFIANFDERVLEILRKFKQISEDECIPADGVVAEIDIIPKFITDSEIYDETSIALKFGAFTPMTYKSRVVRVEMSTRKVKGSVVAIIEPVLAENGNTLTRVNCFNPDILIREGIRPGSSIEFEYKSNNNINLIRKYSS